MMIIYLKVLFCSKLDVSSSCLFNAPVDITHLGAEVSVAVCSLSYSYPHHSLLYW